MYEISELRYILNYGETEKVDFMGNFFLNAFEQMLNSEMYEYPETYVGKAYAEMSEDDELEVLEEYLKYRKQRRLGD